MKTLKIFLSRKDDFYGSAIKIKQQIKINLEILYIEDFIENLNDNVNTIYSSDIIYFLCNGNDVLMVIDKIKYIGCNIINKDFLIMDRKKLEIQKLLQNSDVSIPEIIDYDKFNKSMLPVFCKQDSHTGMVFKAYTENTIISFFEKFGKEDYYIEESLTDKVEFFEEFKAYYSAGNVYPSDGNEMFEKEIVDICRNVSKCLDGLQFFSLDFIRTNKGIYVIDVNPASGFYSSSMARTDFIKYCENID